MQVGDAVHLRNEPDGQGENGNVASLARHVLRSIDFMMELRRQAARLRTSVADRRTRNNELEAKKKALERQKMLQDVQQANLAMRIQVT